MEELSSEFEGLSVGKREYNFKTLLNSNKEYTSWRLQNFALNSKEIGTIVKFHKTGRYIVNDETYRPVLKKNICSYIDNPSQIKNIKKSYIGHNLLTGFETYVPLTWDKLNDLDGLLKFIEDWNTNNNSCISGDFEFTIISLRHHFIDLLMVPFQTTGVSLIATYHNGMILLSEDRASGRKFTGIHSRNLGIKQICYTGFELENILVENYVSDDNFYSIVEHIWSKNIKVILQCEMDSYNPVKNTYTEIKSSVNFNLKNEVHRRKLLRMWIQTSLIPESDLIIGFRDPYNNQLLSLKNYERVDIYNKLFQTRNNSNGFKRFYDFNGSIAVQWSNFILPKICELIKAQLQGNSTQSFRLKVGANLQISLISLKKSPKGLIPEWFE